MTNRQIKAIPKQNEKYKPYLVMQAFYRMLHILSCLDYGFNKHKSNKSRLFWKLITVLRLVFIIGLDLILMDYGESLNWFLFYLGNYFINALVLMSISSNKTFCQLYRDLKNIDIKLRKSSASYKLEIKIVSCAILDIAFKNVVYTMFCVEKNDCVRPLLTRYVYIWLITTLTTVQSSCAFAFYSLFCRLKHLSSILQKEKRDYLSMQFIYKSIVDLAEMQKSAFSPLLLLSIFFTTFEVMTYILSAVKEVKEENNVTIQTDLLIVAVNLATIFAPALSAEVLARQKDKLTLILHDKIMHERDPSRQRELEQFTRYVEARPLRFQLYGVIPLDASLLGMVLNFAVTYLIVIIQFTYKK